MGTIRSEESVNEKLKLFETEIRLEELIRSCLDRGSVGVQRFVDNIYPLWQRWNNGERSMELCTQIMMVQP